MLLARHFLLSMLIHERYLSSWLLALVATSSVAHAGFIPNYHDLNPSRPQCSPVSFTLSATAENLVFSPNPNPNNATEVLDFMRILLNTKTNVITSTQTVSGNFTLNGIYCAPSGPKSKVRNVLQILIHGASYEKHSWSGWNRFGDRYDYPLAAAREGYHTLAIDRLSHGTNPDKPDPVNVVQPDLQIELSKQLIATVRSSASNPLGKKFSKIVWVGHSFGSMMGVAYARLYGTNPSLIYDALVATGLSSTLNQSVLASMAIDTAANIDPARFGSLPAGYVTFEDLETRERSFYSGQYDRAVARYDFDNKDFISIGEFAGLGPLLQPAVRYRKPTMVVTGVEDAIFCGPAGFGPGECDRVLEKTRTDLFPDLPESRYEYFAPRKTGHDQSLHLTAPETAGRIHEFLNKYF